VLGVTPERGESLPNKVGQYNREFDGVKDSVAASSAAVAVADDFEQMKVADLKKF